MLRRPALFATASLLAALPARGLADDPFARGVDPVGGRLATTAEAFLTVEGARTAPAGTVGLSLFADYGHGLLSLRLGDRKLDDLVVHRLDLHLLGSWALTDWLELGADLPVTVLQHSRFERLEAETGLRTESPAGAGLGDLRLVGKVRLLQEASHGVGIAALAELRLPTGSADDFLGERGVSVAPAVVAERRFGDVRLALGGGYRYRSEAGRFVNLYVGDELSASLAGAWELPASVLGGGWTALAELLAATPARAPLNGPDADAMKTGLEALVGLRGDLGAGFQGLVGAGTGLSTESGYGRAGMRAFAGVRWQGSLQGGTEGDRDGDGIPDELDACPNTPGLPEFDGCPDSDGDQIPDHEDACPDQPGPARWNGCPAGDPLVVYEGGKLELRGAVLFDTGKATIKRESWGVLDEVAAVLHKHPELRRVRIDGHTDDVGSAQLNRDLSRRRAASVVQYLVDKGIAADRMESAGFGEDQPIATNATALGRARNRRVEFTVLETR